MYNGCMVSRIIHESKPRKTAKDTLESVHKRAYQAALRELAIRVRDQKPEVRKIAENTLEDLTKWMVEKARPDLTDKPLYELQGKITKHNDEQLVKLEKHLSTVEAVRLMSRIIGAAVCGVAPVTQVKVSVPHGGRLGELYDSIRRAREFSACGAITR